MESELDNLLKINEMYQDTIQELEGIVRKKDSIIADHLSTIAILTDGKSQELKDIRLTFFSSHQELVGMMSKQKREFVKHNETFDRENKLRDATEKQLREKYEAIKEELLTAKKILKDPNLSLIATRKFNGHIEKSDPGKFMAKNCVLSDLQEEPEKETEEFEVEMI